MIEIEERGMIFSFPDDWQVIKYDDSSFHKTVMLPIEHTQAVDFVVCNDNKMMLLEAKRYKERPFSENNSNIEHFIDEICYKIKDTICGLAISKTLNCIELINFYNVLFNNSEKPDIKITLFLEIENPKIDKSRRKSILSNIMQKLSSKFHNADFTVRVVDSSMIKDKCPWKVRFKN